MSKITPDMSRGLSLDVSEQPNQICPNCNSEGLSIFYAIDDIPVHSCLLMSSRAEALEYPRGHLRLGFCNSCGFITNTRFDANVHNYSTQYEETQGFSACFSAFARSLARKLIDEYDIHNKTVLEIGCGKGEFLALMCKLGGNCGIGIDPAYVPQRNPAGHESQVEFIQDFYSEKYAYLKADVICCRHTLEHIAPTWRFMQTLRKTIGQRTDILVFFELPDVMRVLQEGAFWDIYYEHCSYFTAGSLARLFRFSGFEIDGLYLDYDNQYIIITAYPTDGPTSASLELEDDLEQLTRTWGQFKENCSNKISYWQGTIRQIIADGQKAVIWGSGSKGVAFLTTLELMDQIKYVVDINPYKQGKYMPGTGQKIVSPQFLTRYRPDKIVVMNPVYCDEIQRDLERLGIEADLLAV